MKLITGDCREVLLPMPDDSIDLIFCSPPYEAARTYGIDFNLRGDAWVDWAFDRFCSCLRVCRGLVAWVVQGQTRNFCWSATPVLLMAELHRAGYSLRNPAIYKRHGIPGSGGPDWLRSDYEWIICATRRLGELPWSDNVACGHPPKFPPVGEMSNRRSDGRRVNAPSGRARKGYEAPSTADRAQYGSHRSRRRGGKVYMPPELVNPGNVIDCGAVGGVNMGSPLAHENEAPFPEKLAEFFVKSFCPPGGIVMDPFCGSGTTGAMALKHGRDFVGIDIRQSQIDLTQRRLQDAVPVEVAK